MRILVAVTAALGGLAATGAASAVLPVGSKSFKGVTSERGINGFRADITFRTAPGSRSIRNFVFETIGCFGHGAFPVGVDPFADTVWRIATIPVSAKGILSAQVRPKTTRPDSGTMTATITGSFSSPTRLVGKVTFSQVQNGAECGPQTVKFAATVSAPAPS
jgi:hypothetical protein